MANSPSFRQAIQLCRLSSSNPAMDTSGTSRQPLVVIEDDHQAVSRNILRHRNSAKPPQPKSQTQRLPVGSSVAKTSMAAVQNSSAQGLLKPDWQLPSSAWTTPKPLPPPAAFSTAQNIIKPHIHEECRPAIALADQPASTGPVQRASGQVAMRLNAFIVSPSRPEAGGRKDQHQMSPPNGPHAFQPGSLIDLSDDDEISDYRDDTLSDHQFELWLHQQTLCEQRHSRSISVRPLPSRRYSLDRYDHEGIMLYSNVCVELADGDFMRIDRLLQDHTTKEVFLSGWLFQRMRSMNGIAEKKLNEVAWIMHWTKSDSRNIKQQCLHEVNVSQVVKRRALKLTNQTYPALSFRDDLSIAESTEIAEHSRVLVCRWTYICTYADDKARIKNIHDGRALVRLREEESDKHCGCSEEYLRQCWRGETAVGGSSSAVGSKERQQLERERRLAQDAAARMHRQANISGTNNTSNTWSTLAGSRADVPLDLDSLDVSSQSAAHPPPDSHSQISWALSNRRSITSNEGVEDASEMRFLSQSAESMCASDPVDLTLDNDMNMGFQLITPNQAIRAQDQPVCSEALAPQSRRCETLLDVVDVDARIKFTSKRGMAEKHWEGQITTKHSPAMKDSISGIKRNRQSAFSARATEDSFSTELGIRNRPHKASRSGHEAPSRLSSPADSDATLSRGCSPSLVILEEEDEAQESRKKRQKISPHSPRNLTGTSAAKKSSTQSGTISKAHKRYTFGDGFCGCGGSSRGARMAGLRLKWAFDNEQDMCESYRLNFPEARVMCISAFDFAMKNNHDCKVDILHLSPPCQFFSPAHTTQGQNDELNTAPSFVISALLRKTQPRIVTLENTSGLEQRHHLYLNAVIQQFTSLGFSIRWKVVDLRGFGVPQTRRRLIMIAAW